MKKIICFLFLYCTAFAQNVYSDNCDVFFDTLRITSKFDAFYILDSTFQELYGRNDSVTVDQSNAYNLTSNFQWRNQISQTSPILNGGTSVNFISASSQQMVVNNNDFNYLDTLTIGVIAKTNTISGGALNRFFAEYLLWNNASGRPAFGYKDNLGVQYNMDVGSGSWGGEWKYLVGQLSVTADTSIFWLNGNPVVKSEFGNGSSTSIQSNTGRSVSIGSDGNANSTYFNGQIAIAFVTKNFLTPKEIKDLIYLPKGWVSTIGNLSRSLSAPDFFVTAWSDTLCIPLPDATLGTNQEWVLTLSNIDDVTAWIGSRSSAKSVKKSITGGASFTANTTYFGDGFSLVSDSLVVVFPADTASVDNIVFKKAQHHSKSPANRGWLGW